MGYESLCWHLISAYWKYPEEAQSSGHSSALGLGAALWTGQCSALPRWPRLGLAPRMGTPSPALGLPLVSGAALPGTGAFQASARQQQGPTAHRSALRTSTWSLLRKDVLVDQTELGMQINWCKCRINCVNSCKIKAWLFSESLPGSQVHWATVTLTPLKIFEVEWFVFCHYYSLIKFGHSSVHGKCALIILSVLSHS